MGKILIAWFLKLCHADMQALAVHAAWSMIDGSYVVQAIDAQADDAFEVLELFGYYDEP